MVFDTLTPLKIYDIIILSLNGSCVPFASLTFFNVNGNVHVSCLRERRVVSKTKLAMVGSGATFRRTTTDIVLVQAQSTVQLAVQTTIDYSSDA